MLEIYYHPLCPYSRKLRVVLAEKKIEHRLELERYWERRPAFLELNPAGDTPAVVKPDKTVLAGNTAIIEYFEEVIEGRSLLGEALLEKAYARRIWEWFDVKFYHEVTRYLLNEKFIKVTTRVGEPNSGIIRAAKKNIAYHLDYLAHLLGDNDYLGGEKFSIADLAAACQLSVLDFLGDVPWERSAKVKEWYSLMKSRPSFKPLLTEKVSGFTPPSHYMDPDF